jgi:hypothetical protein
MRDGQLYLFMLAGTVQCFVRPKVAREQFVVMLSCRPDPVQTSGKVAGAGLLSHPIAVADGCPAVSPPRQILTLFQQDVSCQ